MDEPNEKQDNSSAEQAETSEQEPETFTKEQMEEGRRQARSDALAESGRVRKLNEGLIKSSQAIQDRLDRRDKEDDERERERYRDEPDKLSAIDERIKRRTAETKLAEREQELSEKDEKIKHFDEKEVESTKERNAREVATRLGVDPKILAKLAKFTDGSTEAIEAEAKVLPQVSEPRDPLKPDSNKTIGSGIVSLKTVNSPGFAEKYLSDSGFRDKVDTAWREGKLR